jgi:hypothetical protein
VEAVASQLSAAAVTTIIAEDTHLDEVYQFVTLQPQSCVGCLPIGGSGGGGETRPSIQRVWAVRLPRPVGTAVSRLGQ